MGLLQTVQNLIGLTPGKSVTVSGTLPTFSAPNPPQPELPKLREDFHLSDSFMFSELTKTSNTAFQIVNRTVTDEQIMKLKFVANLLQQCRLIIGKIYNKPSYPIDVHSGYRCPELNGSTIGSSKTSQHMLCEAADWSPVDHDTIDQLTLCFNAIRESARKNEIKFGQLIIETAKRDYGVVYWLHISLGYPYRPIEKCGQVLHMINGIYTLVETIPPQQEVAKAA